MINVIGSSFTQGVVWAVMAIGVYVMFRLFGIANLSAEGVFPLGAAITASLISNGVDPVLATLASFIGGMLGGLLAGWMHTKLLIPPLLTGIMVLTGLYSINLHVMQGRPNIALLGQDTIYTWLNNLSLSPYTWLNNLSPSLYTWLNNFYAWLNNLSSSLSKNMTVSIVSLIVLAIVIALLVLFLNTEIGLALRSTGDNEEMSKANGINTDFMIILGYMIANGLIGLAGSMVAQKDGFSDIGMGIGTIVIGLASIIVAEVIFPNKSIGVRLITVIIGSFVYRLIIDTILNQPFIDIKPTDLRLFSAILLTVVLYLPEMQRRRAEKNRRKALNEGGSA